MQFQTTFILLLAAVTLTGCERYQPMPLDGTAVTSALSVPAPDQLRAMASQIHHPLLQPVTLEPTRGLTPDQAAILAVLLNPALRAQRDQHSSGEAAVIAAGLLPNPQLSYSYDFVTGGNTLGAVNAYGWGLNYDINALLSHNANVKSANASAQSIDLTIAWQEWQTALAAKMSVYDLISLQQQLDIAQQIDDRLADNLKVIQQAADAGLKTTIDLSAAESASRDAHAITLQARRDVRHQQLLLNQAIGLPANTPVMLRAGLQLDTHFDAAADDHVENHRLDLLALRMGYESQEQTLRAAVINQIPRINIGFSRQSDNTDVHSIGPAITIDLPVFDHNQGSIAAEKATRQRLRDEFIDRVFQAKSDIATALADITAINDQIADAQAAVPNLQTLVTAYKQAIDHGNADVLSYYQAWNNLAQKNLDVLKLQQQLADTRIALELATGQYQSNTDKAHGAAVGPEIPK